MFYKSMKFVFQNVCLGFHRLAIIDSLYGMQPMKLHRFPLVTMICNGEIFNWKLVSI